MKEKNGRNDPCPCGSGKKYKKCCGLQKKLSSREASVITASSQGSLLNRISAGGAFASSSKEKSNSLKNRIAKSDAIKDSKKSD